MQNYSRKHVQSEIAHHFVVASIKNTREITCKTPHSTAASPKKLWKLEQNRDPTLNRHQKVKIPRAYACKTPTQDLLEVKICEIPKKDYQKLKTDQGAKKVLKRETCAENAQNAIHVAETSPRRSECDTRRQSEVLMLRMRYMLKKRYPGFRMQHVSRIHRLGVQNAIHVKETLPGG